MDSSSYQICSTDSLFRRWGGEYTPPAQPVADPVDAVAESSVADVGDASPVRQPDLNDACASSSLFAPDSEQSMCRDDPQAPWWTKRGEHHYRVRQ